MVVILTFLMHMAICILALLLFWGIPILVPATFGFNIPSNFWGGVYVFVPLIIHLILIFFYYKKGLSLFALPLSHFLFPILFLIMFALIDMGLPGRLPSSEISYVVMFSFMYFFPFALATLIISIIIRIRCSVH